MSKKISSILFLLFLSVSVFAQKNKPVAPVLPIDDETKLVSYTGVVDATGVSKKRDV